MLPSIVAVIKLLSLFAIYPTGLAAVQVRTAYINSVHQPENAFCPSKSVHLRTSRKGINMH